jgi:AcrR family transcriptional regulator
MRAQAAPAAVDDQGGPAGKRAPRQRDAARTRQTLLTVARRRFAADGYAATTVRDIAADAGVNVALINRYFTSKEGLFEACLTSAADELRQIAVTAGGSQAERIARSLLSINRTGSSKILPLLLRSSGDERADRLRLDILQTFSESLASAAGRTDEGRDVLLRAQLVLALSIGIGVLRTSPGVEPLASSDSDDLVEPLRRVIETLLV